MALDGQSAVNLMGEDAEKTTMPDCRQHCVTVDLDGLGMLRLALAAQRAGSPVVDRPAFRALPKQRPVRGAGLAGRAATASSNVAVGAVATATATSTETEVEAPRIPTQAPPSDPIDEQQLVMSIVTRAQAGDAEAFGELYDRYNQIVYRYIAYRCSNATLAEDLTSETFLRALRRISTYTWQGRDFGAWLVTIARNLLADHFKSGRYRMEIATSDLVEAGADRHTEGPEDHVLASMTNQALVDAIKQLGSEQQECIVLRFLQGLSVAETALALGKNEGAIKALQYRAVKSLGRLLPMELIA